MPSKENLIHVRSPGRLELLGNHTDYNGGWVIGVAINRFIDLRVKASSDNRCRVKSEGYCAVSTPFGDWQKFSGDESWSNYVWGVAKELHDSGLLEKPFELCYESSLPAGSGLSSSAAIEVGTALGLLKLSGHTVRPKTIIQLCRKAENQFVGVPSGILDQSSCLLGEAQKGVLVQCDSETFESVDLPSDWHLTVIQSGGGHKLVESPYKQRFEECQKAFQLLCQKIEPRENLCAFSVDEVEKSKEFLADNLFKRAFHVSSEQQRVKNFIRLLKDGDYHQAGGLLTQSHESSRDYFENSTERLDFLVEHLIRLPQVIGSRLTGGGFGGGVLALSSGPLGKKELSPVLRAFEDQYGAEPEYFSVVISEGARLISYPEDSPQ